MKLKSFWEKLNVNITVNQRELILGVTVCALAGIVIGMIFSPKKWVMIGSQNGNGRDDEGKVMFDGNEKCDEDEEIPFN